MSGTTKRLAFTLVISCTCSLLFAQYTGGAADGSSYSSLIQAACVPSSNNIFYGGASDGSASGALTQTICTPPASNNIYTGGSDDGYASGALTQTACPPAGSVNIFSGGAADGFAYSTLTQGACPPVTNTNIFFGGIADGFSKGNLSQTACTPLINTNIFFGGAADGFDTQKLIQNTSCDPLPVELLSFTAECDESKVVLEWITATETNSSFFTIERTTDGINYTAIGMIPGAGTTTSIHTYSFTDNSPLQGTVYYRLKQTDFDGQYQYLPLVSANCNEDISIISIYPNPASNDLQFTVSTSEQMDLTLKVIDVLGRALLTHSCAVSPGITPKTIDISFLPAGTYMLQVYADDQLFYSQKQFIVE